MRTLRWCLSARFLKAVCILQVGQIKSSAVSNGLAHVKKIAVFITLVQHLAETLLSKIRRGKRQQ